MDKNHELRATLERAAGLTNPTTGTVRLVCRSSLDLYEAKQHHTGQPFSRATGGVPPPA